MKFARHPEMDLLLFWQNSPHFGVASDENIDITKFPFQRRNAVILLKHKLNLTLFMLGCCEEK